MLHVIRFMFIRGNFYNIKVNTIARKPWKSNTLLLWKRSLWASEAINVKVNVYVYSVISHWVKQTSQFTSLVLEFSFIPSHLIWAEFSIWQLFCSCSQSLQFWLSHSTGYPSMLDWQRRHDIRGLPNFFTHIWQRDTSTGHPSKYSPGSTLLNFQWSDGNWLPLSHMVPQNLQLAN